MIATLKICLHWIPEGDDDSDVDEEMESSGKQDKEQQCKVREGYHGLNDEDGPSQHSSI